MSRGLLSGCRIHPTHELRVVQELLEHARMLAAYGTMDNGCARSLGYCTRRPDCHRAVDNRQAGPEELDIAGGLADKIIDPERVTDMHDIDTAKSFGWRRKI